MTLCSVLTDGVHAHGCISICHCEQVNIFGVGGGAACQNHFIIILILKKMNAHVMFYLDDEIELVIELRTPILYFHINNEMLIKDHVLLRCTFSVISRLDGVTFS